MEGNLKCDLCGRAKDVSEFWWCETCISVFCSRCDITDHRQLKHQAQMSEWTSKGPIKFALAYLAQIRRSGSSQNQQEVDEKISTFFTDVAKELQGKLGLCKNDSEDDRIFSVISTLESLYGISRTDEGENVKAQQLNLNVSDMNEDSGDKACRVVNQALKLAGVQAEPLKLPNLAQKLHGGARFSGFKISADEAATYLLDKVVFGNRTEEMSNGIVSTSKAESGSIPPRGTQEGAASSSKTDATPAKWDKPFPTLTRISSSHFMAICPDQVGVWTIIHGSLACEYVGAIKAMPQFEVKDACVCETTGEIFVASLGPDREGGDCPSPETLIKVYHVDTLRDKGEYEIGVHILTEGIANMTVACDKKGEFCYATTTYKAHQNGEKPLQTTYTEIRLVRGKNGKVRRPRDRHGRVLDHGELSIHDHICFDANAKHTGIEVQPRRGEDPLRILVNFIEFQDERKDEDSEISFRSVRGAFSDDGKKANFQSCPIGNVRSMSTLGMKQMMSCIHPEYTVRATERDYTQLDEQNVKHEVSEFSMEWNPNVELSSACSAQPHALDSSTFGFHSIENSDTSCFTNCSSNLCVIPKEGIPSFRICHAFCSVSRENVRSFVIIPSVPNPEANPLQLVEEVWVFALVEDKVWKVSMKSGTHTRVKLKRPPGWLGQGVIHVMEKKKMRVGRMNEMTSEPEVMELSW